MVEAEDAGHSTRGAGRGQADVTGTRVTGELFADGALTGFLAQRHTGGGGASALHGGYREGAAVQAVQVAVPFLLHGVLMQGCVKVAL